MRFIVLHSLRDNNVKILVNPDAIVAMEVYQGGTMLWPSAHIVVESVDQIKALINPPHGSSLDYIHPSDEPFLKQAQEDELRLFYKDVLIALAGAVCTPVSGYEKNGGLGYVLTSIQDLRKNHDILKNRAGLGSP